VDNRSEIRDFLASRRARLSPHQAGLSPHGIRRVPGLRRSEVAALAGVKRTDLPNHARFVFLDTRAGQFWIDWDRVADASVGLLHMQAARQPYDKALADLIGELSTRSDPFRVRWARHDVRAHTTGTKRLHHPVVGRLELTFEVLTPAADGDQALVVYGAEPGSAAADGLRLLAGWAATREEQPPDPDTGRT